MDKRKYFLMTILILFVHAEFQFGRFKFFGVVIQFSSVEIAIALTISLFLLFVISFRDVTFFFLIDKKFIGILALFVISLILSTIYAHDKIEALKYDVRIISGIMIYFILVWAMNIEKVYIYSLTLLTTVGIYVSLIGIMEYFDLFGIKTLFLKNFWGFGSRSGSVTSIFIHNNTFGHYLVLQFFLLLSLIYYIRGKKFLKNVLGICLCLLLINILMSLSRGSWANLFLSTILLFLCSKKKILILKHGMIIALFLSTLLCFLPKTRYRIFTRTPYDIHRGNVFYRVLFWEHAIQLFRENPIFGVGLNNFKNTVQNRDLLVKHKFPLNVHTAHNQFFNTLAEQGIIGAAAYLALFIYLTKMAYMNIKMSGNIYLSVALFSYFISSIFEYMWMDYSFMFLFWFVVAGNYCEHMRLARSIGNISFVK